MGVVIRANQYALGLAAFACAASGAAPTYSKDAAPVLFKNCVKCHRPGGIEAMAPFSSYGAVRPWAKSIREKILTREMPPWPADPRNSLKFRNDARLSQSDINTLVAWIDAGAPKGNESDLPATPRFTTGWLQPQGLKPDLIIALPGEVQIPAQGEIPYLRYLVKVPLGEDRWVSAIQTQPTNAALVHHMALTEVALDPQMSTPEIDPLASIARQLGFRNESVSTRPAVTAPSNTALFDMLGVYTPGTTIETYTGDSAKLLRGGPNFYINFNIHYQAIGQPAKDRSMVAFWFRSGPPKHQLFRVPGAGETILANGNELMTDAPGTKAEGTRVHIPPIPPFAGNYELTGITGYREQVTIYQLHPHAHLRARDFKYEIVYPDGREQAILTVPRYDFRWQLAYDLETPLRLPAGSKMIVSAHYDNSRNNNFNPAPEKEVFFRDQNQSWDEMFTPFIQYSIDNQDLTSPDRAEHDLLPVVEVVGCLRQESDGKWTLLDASEPSLSSSQSTTSEAVKAAHAQPLGNRQYRLLGLDVFSPSTRSGLKVVAKGVLIADTAVSRLNVTSLQPAGQACER